MNQGIYESHIDISRILQFFHVHNSKCVAHFHENIEIVYVVNGQIEYTNNNGIQILSAGEVIFIPPYVPHQFRSVGETYSMAVVIPGHYQRDYRNEIGDLFFPKMTDSDKNKEILRLMKEIEQNIPTTPEIIRIGQVNLLLGYIVTHYPSTPYQKNDILTKDIAMYIEKHFQEKITLEEIATYFGYNRCYFSRLFKTLFHMSFPDYVNNIRCNYIQRNLKDGNITELIYQSGFVSTSSYYRHVKKTKTLDDVSF